METRNRAHQLYCRTCGLRAEIRYTRSRFIPQWRARLTMRGAHFVRLSTRGYYLTLYRDIETWHNACNGSIDRLEWWQ